MYTSKYAYKYIYPIVTFYKKYDLVKYSTLYKSDKTAYYSFLISIKDLFSAYFFSVV